MKRYVYFILFFLLGYVTYCFGQDKRICITLDGVEQQCWFGDLKDVPDVPPPPPNCEDNNLCTIDTVVNNLTCEHTPKTCSPGSACNPDTGECVLLPPPPPPNCEDNNLCTIDTVVNNLTCEHTPIECTNGGQCNKLTGACDPPPPPPPPVTDTGVSDVPTQPVNKRVIVVNPTNVVSAIDKILPGDTIQLTSGTYTTPIVVYRSGTKLEPVTIQPAPGHKPILNRLLQLRGSWLIVEGLEITGAHDGMSIVGNNGPTANNITVRKNKIHRNGFQGMLISSASNVLVEDNILEMNGLGPGNCTDAMWGGLNYSHCHGIYVSDSTYCVGPIGLTIRRNIFRGNSGSGIQFYSNCKKTNAPLVENNLFVDNGIGMYLWQMTNGVIRNNTVVQLKYPGPQKDGINFLGVNHTLGNVVVNNLFYSIVPGYPSDAVHYPLHIWLSSVGKDKFMYNRFFVDGSTNWVHNDLLVRNFVATYAAKTGDTTSIVDLVGTISDNKAGFVTLPGDYRLKETSNSYKKGLASQCPKTDITGKLRPTNTCSIGAYE